MKRRELDIRLTADARRALVGLQRHYGISRPGDLLRVLATMGIRPLNTIRPRGEACCRMRATVDDRLAQDLACVARAEDTSMERYVEALILTAHTAAFGTQGTEQPATGAMLHASNPKLA